MRQPGRHPALPGCWPPDPRPHVRFQWRPDAHITPTVMKIKESANTAPLKIKIYTPPHRALAEINQQVFLTLEFTGPRIPFILLRHLLPVCVHSQVRCHTTEKNTIGMHTHIKKGESPGPEQRQQFPNIKRPTHVSYDDKIFRTKKFLLHSNMRSPLPSYLGYLKGYWVGPY